MSRTIARVASALLLAGSAIALTAPSGSAATGPWQPVTQPAFTVPAGKYCDFQFSYQPDKQQMKQRVVETWPSGAPKVIEFTGQLHGTTTNDETGASIHRNASGRAVEHLDESGAITRYEMYGPVGYGFRDGDGYAKGYYLFHGQYVVEIDATGKRTMVSAHGVEENICQTLG